MSIVRVQMVMDLHPRPQTRPMTVREAWADLDENPIDGPKISKTFFDYWQKSEQGGAVGKYNCDRRLSLSCPSPTIRKGGAYGGYFHPTEPRPLTTAERKRLSSFPDAFFFSSWKSACERIGNSVPPKLMEAIARHIQKEILKHRGRPTVVSTFAGGGGSSLGYQMAGYRELLAVEWDDDAVRTLRDNFMKLQVYHGDIKELSVKECLRLIQKKPGELDVLDGSPPCQGFSTAGKRNFGDPRNSLFGEFVRLLEGLKPKVFVMENMKGMIKGPMKRIFLQIMEALRGAGYHVEAQVMNAKFYGVPQSRERVIFIGLRQDL